jgi:hypothetical protein
MGLLATSQFYFIFTRVEVCKEQFIVFNQMRERDGELRGSNINLVLFL